MTEEHLRAALTALSSEPPNHRAAMDALEETIIEAEAEGMDSLLASSHDAAARWATWAILRGPKEVAHIVKALEYALDRARSLHGR